MVWVSRVGGSSDHSNRVRSDHHARGANPHPHHPYIDVSVVTYLASQEARAPRNLYAGCRPAFLRELDDYARAYRLPALPQEGLEAAVEQVASRLLRLRRCRLAGGVGAVLPEG